MAASHVGVVPAPVLQESRCDAKDNDCDGNVDETFPLKGTACQEDGTFGTTRKLGSCRGQGSLVCNGAQSGLACNVTTAGAAPKSETCNNADDDCDGHTDEPYDSNGFTGVRDAVVGPLTINGKSIVMYKYEASRPDASSGAMGISQARSCSTLGKMPWAGPDLAHAQAACAAAGMRLCKGTRDGSGNITSDEWGRFCAGAGNRIWPYGDAFAPQTCNGSAYDPVPGGAAARCRAAPVRATCGGTCRDLAQDVNNCGACGAACAPGQGCFNGYCCPAGTMLCPGTDQCKASCP